MGYGMSAAVRRPLVPVGVQLPHQLLEPGVRRSSGTSATQEGGLEKLKGKKIAHIFHNSPYGKEANPTLEELAKKYSSS